RSAAFENDVSRGSVDMGYRECTITRGSRRSRHRAAFRFGRDLKATFTRLQAARTAPSLGEHVNDDDARHATLFLRSERLRAWSSRPVFTVDRSQIPPFFAFLSRLCRGLQSPGDRAKTS